MDSILQAECRVGPVTPAVHSQLTRVNTLKPAVPVSWECTAGVTGPTLHAFISEKFFTCLPSF